MSVCSQFGYYGNLRFPATKCCGFLQQNATPKPFDFQSQSTISKNLQTCSTSRFEFLLLSVPIANLLELGLHHQVHPLRHATHTSNIQCCLNQKTREGCGCFRGLFGGCRGKLRESPGKIAGKFFPNREMLQILVFRAPGKENLAGTFGRHCRDLVPTFRAGCFLKSTVPAFSSFSD